MSEHTTSRATRYLPQVVVATICVAVLPVAAVWILLDEGVISSPWAGLGLAITFSLAVSAGGSAYWKRRSGHGDLLFSELLLWGWVHRYRAERQIASAVDLLGLTNPEPGLAQTHESTQRKAQILRQMAAALDAQDPYTDGHSRRVALHAAMIARKMGLPDEEIGKVRSAAAVHDIGKLRIPPEVLHKPGMLTAAEFDVVKRHAEDGAEIVSVMEDPDITATVRHHHERFDGNGYPDGLVGRQTPLAARIIAVADTFDALTSVRPYRSAIPHRKALATIVDVSGTQLDPAAVRAFVKCYSGRRWLVFWTMLAATPRRAFSGFARTRPGHGMLASATTAASPATVAAVVAGAIGGIGSLGHMRHGLEYAQRQPVQATAGSSGSGGSPGSSGSGTRPSGTGRRTSGRDAGDSNPAPPPARRAALGIPTSRQVRISAARQLGLAKLGGANVAADSGPGPGVHAGGGGVLGGTGGLGGNGAGAGSTGTGGGGSQTVFVVSQGSPGGPPATTPGGTGGGTPVASTTPSPPPSGSPAGGGPPGGTPGETGTGGPGGPSGGDATGHAGGGNPGDGGGGSKGGPGGSAGSSDGSSGPGGRGPGAGGGSSGHGGDGSGSPGDSSGHGGGSSPSGSGSGAGDVTPGGGSGAGSDQGSGAGRGSGRDSGRGKGSGGGGELVLPTLRSPFVT